MGEKEVPGKLLTPLPPLSITQVKGTVARIISYPPYFNPPLVPISVLEAKGAAAFISSVYIFNHIYYLHYLYLSTFHYPSQFYGTKAEKKHVDGKDMYLLFNINGLSKENPSKFRHKVLVVCGGFYSIHGIGEHTRLML